jgi:hypothetical protein
MYKTAAARSAVPVMALKIHTYYMLGPGVHILSHEFLILCRARQHAKSVSWLRRTEYISTEYARPHGSGEGAETK